MLVHVSDDPARACARFVGARLSTAASERGTASLAVSGGSTAPPLFAALVATDLAPEEWETVEIWQVDERIAPDGDPDRNAGQLVALPGTAHPMPVTADDLAAAAGDYASTLPDTFDVVHLGVGADGHTASWPPRPHPDAESALVRVDPVFAVGEFNGRDRMTLGPTVVNAARCRVVLATGEQKARVVADWVAGNAERGRAWVDPDLPIATVSPRDTRVFLDGAAASLLHSDDSMLGVGDRPPDVAVEARRQPN